MSLVHNFFGSLFFFSFVGVWNFNGFAHYKKFGGFSEMEVGCVPRKSMGLLIIEVFFFGNGSYDLLATFTDISM